MEENSRLVPPVVEENSKADKHHGIDMRRAADSKAQVATLPEAATRSRCERVVANHVHTIAAGRHLIVAIDEHGALQRCDTRNTTRSMAASKKHSPHRSPLQPVTLNGVRFVSVAAAGSSKNPDHVLAVDETGGVHSFGGGTDGKLCHGDTSDVSAPKRITAMGGHTVIGVSTSIRTSLMLTSAHEVFACGANHYGQLGLGHTEPAVLTPTRLDSLVGVPVCAISAGEYHTHPSTTQTVEPFARARTPPSHPVRPFLLRRVSLPRSLVGWRSLLVGQRRSRHAWTRRTRREERAGLVSCARARRPPTVPLLSELH